MNGVYVLRSRRWHDGCSLRNCNHNAREMSKPSRFATTRRVWILIGFFPFLLVAAVYGPAWWYGLARYERVEEGYRRLEAEARRRRTEEARDPHFEETRTTSARFDDTPNRAREQPKAKAPFFPIHRGFFSDDDRFLFLSGTDQVLRKVDLATGDVQTMDVSIGVWGEVSSDGRFGLWQGGGEVSANGRVPWQGGRLIDFTSGEDSLVDPSGVSPFDVHVAGFTDRPPELVFFNQRKHKWFRRDPRSGRDLWELEPDGMPTRRECDWFRSRKFVLITSHRLRLLDVEKGEWAPFDAEPQGWSYLVLDDDDLGFFYGGRRNGGASEGALFDVRSGRTTELTLDGDLISLSMTRDRAWTTAQMSDYPHSYSLRELELSRDTEPVWTVVLRGPYNAVKPAHSKWIFLHGYNQKDRIELLDIETRALRAIGPQIERGLCWYFRASPDGKYLLHIDDRRLVVIWVEEPFRYLSTEIPANP